MSEHKHDIQTGVYSLAWALAPAWGRDFSDSTKSIDRSAKRRAMFRDDATWVAGFDDSRFGGLGWTSHDRTAQERPLRSRRQALAVVARWVREIVRRKANGGELRHLGSRIERRERREYAAHHAEMRAMYGAGSVR